MVNPDFTTRKFNLYITSSDHGKTWSVVANETVGSIAMSGTFAASGKTLDAALEHARTLALKYAGFSALPFDEQLKQQLEQMFPVTPVSNAMISQNDTLRVGDRILITEETQHALPDGYNWVGSCPIVDGELVGVGYVVHQVGYLYQFGVDKALAERMRADLLKRAAEQQVNNGAQGDTGKQE